MTTKEQFESLIRVLNLQKDRLVLCNLDTEYVDRALELAKDLAKSLEIESQTENKE